MFSTLKQRLLLSLYIFIIISIPVGAYLASQYQNIKSKASETKSKTIVKATPKPVDSAKNDLLNLSQKNLATNSATSSSEEESPTIATNFGPTLSLKISLQGRPEGKQSTRLFVGIIEGTVSQNPKYLLSFTIDIPDLGQVSDLSLAGLNPGNTYSALLKGQAQIATSSAFVMSPTISKLNSDNPVKLLTGDLNDDNIINSQDLGIIKSAFGSSSQAKNWNANADFNLDGVINIIDYAILYRNFNRTGNSGTWSSTSVATTSAQPSEPAIGSPGSGGLPAGRQGYWIWVPDLSH